MKYNQVLQFKLEGYSNRKTAKITGVNRKTVAKKWYEYKEAQAQLKVDENNRLAKEQLAMGRTYDISGRKKQKYTQEIEEHIIKILQEEVQRNQKLGQNKLRTTNAMIHQQLIDLNFDIGLTTVSTNVKRLKKHVTEVYIKQLYKLGERAEYDFGEVKLIIAGERVKVSLAVISCPASNYRFACAYNNQGLEVFKDSHVRFFEQVGGVYGEICYDNMRNVVTRFLGKSKKELNTTLLQLSNYYGFKINVTNAFSGNEKGHVEESVKHVRNTAFALKYSFDSLEDVNEYLQLELNKMNLKSDIEKEKLNLRPYKPPFEVGEYRKVNCNKYGFIRVNNKYYSIPEEYISKDVHVKIYVDAIYVYHSNEKVCELIPIYNDEQYKVDIRHYCNTLKRKPGAITRSHALRSNETLVHVFKKYYSDDHKRFITIVMDNKNLCDDELYDILVNSAMISDNLKTDDIAECIDDSFELLNKNLLGVSDVSA